MRNCLHTVNVYHTIEFKKKSLPQHRGIVVVVVIINSIVPKSKRKDLDREDAICCSNNRRHTDKQANYIYDMILVFEACACFVKYLPGICQREFVVNVLVYSNHAPWMVSANNQYHETLQTRDWKALLHLKDTHHKYNMALFNEKFQI